MSLIPVVVLRMLGNMKPERKGKWKVLGVFLLLFTGISLVYVCVQKYFVKLLITLDLGCRQLSVVSFLLERKAVCLDRKERPLMAQPCALWIRLSTIS